ncbi:MAG: aromatic-ring-hydroxylating dioxygenase subunit beta, partial [Rhodospirillaceae bacterium]|nr:aromatic-ring-hydroxylating dioxygenase subunit beta [Rhodospirillaceae bacterium]
FRRGGKGGEYVGHYVYKLRIEGDGFRIAERRAVLDAEELGGLGAVSFIL